MQRADILGARTFAMRIWLKPERMGALNISPVQVRQALAANNFLAALGRSKGEYIQVNLTADTNLNTVDEFRQLVVSQRNGIIVRLATSPMWCWGPRTMTPRSVLPARPRCSWGSGRSPTPTPSTSSSGCAWRWNPSSATCRSDSGAWSPTTPPNYISNAIREVLKTLGDTLMIVMVVIFLFLGSFRSVLVPMVAIPLSLIGGVFLMQVFGFTINLLTLLAIVLSVGLVVDDAIVVVENVERHLREGKSPTEAALTGARELVGPIIAMTVTLATVYLPIGLQGGLTGSLFREFAFTLAGAVTISGIVALTLSPVMSAKLLKPGGEGRGLAGRITRDFERFKNFYGRLLDATLAARPAVYTVWIVVSLVGPVMFFMSADGARADGGPGGHLRHPRRFGKLDHRPEQPLRGGGQPGVRERSGDRVHLPDHLPQLRFRRHGRETLGSSGSATIFQILPEVQQKLHAIPGIRIFPTLPPALPGGGDFPVEFILASTAETGQILEFANQLQMKAMESKMFAFPPLIDVKVDQPESRFVIDRDKAASLGLNLGQIAGDLGGLVGGNFVNRFDIAGRSYKVIPQIQRVDRLNPDQLKDVYVTGPNGRLVPLGTVATLRESVVPRSLNRFQQLNAVKISGVALRPLDEALRFLEDEAAKILPKGYVIDYTGESRQLRIEGNKFLPAFNLAVILIFLVLAAQFNSFRDPFVILTGSVPLAMSGALLFTFLKIPDPNVPFWTKRLDDHAQHLLAGGAGDPGGAGVQERHPDRRIRQPAAAPGTVQAGGGAPGGRHPSPADPDGQRRHHRRPFPADPGHRRRRRRPEFHRSGPGRRDVHRHLLHPLRRAVDLHAHRPRPRQGPRARCTHRAGESAARGRRPAGRPMTEISTSARPLSIGRLFS